MSRGSIKKEEYLRETQEENSRARGPLPVSESISRAPLPGLIIPSDQKESLRSRGGGGRGGLFTGAKVLELPECSAEVNNVDHSLTVQVRLFCPTPKGSPSPSEELATAAQEMEVRLQRGFPPEKEGQADLRGRKSPFRAAVQQRRDRKISTIQGWRKTQGRYESGPGSNRIWRTPSTIGSLVCPLADPLGSNTRNWV